MANRILKGLAIAAGTGLAVGFTSGRSRTGPVRYRVGQRNGYGSVAPAESAAEPDSGGTATLARDAALDNVSEEFLDIEPLLDRMDRLEVRMDQIAQQGSPEPVFTVNPAASESLLASYAESIADLERRVEQNTRELELLRQSVAGAEARMAESAAAAERRLEQTRAELPAIIESQVTARLGDLQTRFTTEIEQSHLRTLEIFERALDEKISSRIGAIEKALVDQAGSIAALGTRAAETDTNLQRLVTAIERLCERAQLIPPVVEHRPARPPLPRPAQPEARTPFESQLSDAMKGNPAVPMLRREEPAALTQSAPKKARFLFRNLIVAGFALLLEKVKG